MIKMTDINEAANGGGSLAAAPQAQVPPEEDELPVSDENVGSDRNLEKKCIKFGTSVGGFYHRAIAAWPRTSALTFGVVVPLLLLIAVSVFFGYFLAQLEGPGEIEYNNDVISTRIALALQDQLIGNLTENLPHLCACTYLADKTQQGIFDKRMEENEQCLKEQQLQMMPSSYPSFQPSMLPSFTPSMNPNKTNETLTLATNGTSSILPIIESSQSMSSNNITGSKNSTSNEPIVCRKPKSLQTQTIEFAIQRVFISQFKRCEGLNLPNISSDSSGNGTVCTEIGKTTAFESLNVSTGDLLMEMKNCGNDALNITKDYKLTNVITKSLSDASPSWNWNRCKSRNKTTAREENLASNLNQLFNPWVDVSHLNPSYKEKEAENAWLESQQELYCNYVEDGLAEGKELYVARYDALEKSFADANGFDDEDCFPNMWAGSWFWFTIMTTIGYGNTAPATDGGRIMIFTLGFVSILFFGFVLGKAGSIVVAIVEDFLLRTHLSFLTRSWIQMIIWGALYYLWSLLIASYYVYWNELRLPGETVTWNDAYWFAYITTTTVGLGDYYLDHAAIIGIDLLIWPLLILYGFVLLAAFLTALGALAQATDDGSDFADKLAAEESLFSCFPRWFQRDAEFDAHVSARSSIGSVRKPRVVQNDDNVLVNDSVQDDVTNAIPVLNGEDNDGATS
mmetsp:Transcript_13012/g.22196  ORF Transcript_13012/g.22196 Transcript_13012/m.22196 type:complete len:681 (-) Transcript_13012:107-2149(-)